MTDSEQFSQAANASSSLAEVRKKLPTWPMESIRHFAEIHAPHLIPTHEPKAFAGTQPAPKPASKKGGGK